MKQRWAIGLLGVLLLVWALAACSQAQAGSPVQTDQQTVALAVSPTPHSTSLPRPPSEAGQNYGLIAGATLLIVVVIVGILVGSRQRKQEQP